MINIKNLLIGHAIRLKYVDRFSTCRTLHKESVAEHTFFTALYSLVLGEWVEQEQGIDIDFAKLLTKALVHDLEEAITGDIPRDFKHINDDFQETIEKISEVGFQKVAESLFQADETDYWMGIWKNAKDDSLEGKILTFADFLSVISYVYEEVRIASSLSLKEQLTSLHDYYEIFTGPKYSFLNPLVVQVKPILKEIFNGTE